MKEVNDMELYDGRPENTDGRQDNEIRVYDLLDSLGIQYKRTDHEPATTMEVCRDIDAVLDTLICKNLFLCNTQKTKFYLLMIRGDKKFKTKEISSQIHSARLSFAPAEKMEEYLDILPGSVSVLGLMNDKEHQVQLLVDEDVLNAEYIVTNNIINVETSTVNMIGFLIIIFGFSFTNDCFRLSIT